MVVVVLIRANEIEFVVEIVATACVVVVVKLLDMVGDGVDGRVDDGEG